MDTIILFMKFQMEALTNTGRKVKELTIAPFPLTTAHACMAPYIRPATIGPPAMNQPRV